jgi:hypothetical protein
MTVLSSSQQQEPQGYRECQRDKVVKLRHFIF